jgi:hypothetical protein
MTMKRRDFLRAALGTGTLLGSPWPIACTSPTRPIDSGGDTLHLPDPATMMGWIEEIVAQGIRRPGYAADQWIEPWLLDHFQRLGLADVRLEPVALPYWDSQLAQLTLVPDGTRFTGFALPHTMPGTVEAELADFKGGALEARIAVRQIELSTYPQALIRGLATAVHDPANEFDTLVQTLPFHAEQNNVMDSTVAAKASGFVGLLTGVPRDTRDYYVPYDAVERPIPGLWLTGSDGRQLLARMAAGPLQARLEMTADRHPITSHNVIGTLPGNSDEWVIIASHHDGPWASAVEDGSGTSLVLAQATHWAAVPQSQRPHNLLFLLSAGHMAAGAGTQAFIAAHPDLLNKVVLQIHLEHVARRCEPDGAGGLTVTDDPEVRWWFTSKNPMLQATVQAALVEADLRRSMILPPTAFSAMPPTDGAYFYPAGVPLVHFLTAPMYLFDSRDTIDKVHQPSLLPLGQAVVQIIQSTAGVTAAAMRTGTTR